MGQSAPEGDGPIFRRLAKGLESIAAELRQLVEGEDAVVGEAHLPGAGILPPPMRPASEIEW
jgi:hypothetical protein